MDLGMIGLGRMGSNMVRRLLRGGHHCVVFDAQASAVEALAKEGATGAASQAELLQKLAPPRAVWMMLPAGVVDSMIDTVAGGLGRDDVLIDGGNSYYVDDIRRSARLRERGAHYVDVGTSGGVFGLERGYCLMIGGDLAAVQRLDPIFAALAPGAGSIAPTPGRAAHIDGTADRGYLHCGPSGAGHFVKMVHNGIEYGVMAAYAEGMSILQHANIGKHPPLHDAETTPLRNPGEYQYDFNLRDIAEVWRRGSVISSWLLDLCAQSLVKDPHLEQFAGRVADSGEGRWTIRAAIDEAVPVPVLATALFERFSSRGEADYADKLLSAMRFEFGGHVERRAAEGTK
jgi:6-phosphogluconate dehydrogenase